MQCQYCKYNHTRDCFQNQWSVILEIPCQNIQFEGLIIPDQPSLCVVIVSCAWVGRYEIYNPVCQESTGYVYHRQEEVRKHHGGGNLRTDVTFHLSKKKPKAFRETWFYFSFGKAYWNLHVRTNEILKSNF